MTSDAIALSALTAFVEGTARAAGNDCFAALTRNLAQMLQVRDAIVTELVGPRRVRTLAYWSAGRLIGNEEHDVTGTPCEAVLAGDFRHHRTGVARQYPKSETGADSYLGMPLKSEEGSVLGHLCARDAAPMPLSRAQLLLFEAFGASAATQLRRLHTERKARATEEHLRDLFEEAPIAYVLENLDSTFIRANRTAIRILGLRPEEVQGFKGASLVPDTLDAERRVREALVSIGAGTDTSGVLLELRRKDNGKVIFIQWWSRPDPGGQYTRTMFLDVTDRILMEREQARLQAENLYLQEEIKSVHNFEEIIGANAGLLRVLENVQRVAPTDTSVLICGETGTGKELIARAIHSASRRAGKPFIKLNCAALPGGLVESELFGHERGAFSGAIQKRIGRFELANNGTIFLDEIGEMPLDVQTKLLRVLQEYEFERVGSSHTTKVDVRVIAATNRDLAQAVCDGRFRQDLYYRLNVFPVTLPPLRERLEDIPLLARFFAQKYGPRVGRRVESIDAATMQRLVEYPWPGNIRELENLIERALILTSSRVLHVGPEILGLGAPLVAPPSTAPAAPQPHAHQNSSVPLPMDRPEPELTSLAAVQRAHILQVLQAAGWVIEGERGAAARLGMKPATLRFRMRKFGITRSGERS